MSNVSVFSLYTVWRFRYTRVCPYVPCYYLLSSTRVYCGPPYKYGQSMVQSMVSVYVSVVTWETAMTSSFPHVVSV